MVNRKDATGQIIVANSEKAQACSRHSPAIDADLGRLQSRECPIALRNLVNVVASRSPDFNDFPPYVQWLMRNSGGGAWVQVSGGASLNHRVSILFRPGVEAVESSRCFIFNVIMLHELISYDHERTHWR
jgi:hypothetical protein